MQHTLIQSRKALLVVAAVISMFFATALTGCGSSSESGSEKDAFVGEWTLVSMNNSGMEYAGDELAVFGVEASISIAKDGNGSMAINEETADFTWEADSATQMTATNEDGQTVTFTLENNQLTGDQNDLKMVFEKK